MQSGVKEEQLQELNLLGLLICRETPGPVQAETETYRFSYTVASYLIAIPATWCNLQ